MKKKKKQDNAVCRERFRTVGIITVTGIAVLLLLFGILTWQEQGQAVEHAGEMKSFLREHVEQYNTNMENDKAKSLYNLADRMKELSERIGEKVQNRNMRKFLKKFQYEQRLDGIIITNTEQIPVFQTKKDGYQLWKNEITGEIVSQIMKYPEKTYMTLTEKEGELYYFAAVARTDAAGIIAGYRRKSAGSRNSTVTPEKLFYGYTFENDGIAAVTEGEDVLSSNRGELTGKKVKDCPILTSEGKNTIRDQLTKVCLNGENWYRGISKMNGYTLYVIYPEKQIYQSRTTGMLVGTVIYILCAFIYIQVRTRQKRERERFANAAKTDLFRRMSHDIRTPLNGIRGMVPVCKHYTGNPDKQTECLDKIMSASGFLLDLVDDVLDVDRSESGQLEPGEKPFKLSQVLSEVTNVIGMLAEERGIEFCVEMCYCKHDRLIGSSFHLRQILQNIFFNAVKYSRKGGNVRINVVEKEQTQDWSLFEFICRDHVEPVGGSARFEGEENKETILYIAVPFRVDTADEKES